MSITVLVFADLQATLMAKTGTSHTVLDYQDGDTVSSVFERLQTHHGVSLTDTTPKARLRVALNEAFAKWDTPVHDGDEVAFIPPVAGG